MEQQRIIIKSLTQNNSSDRWRLVLNFTAWFSHSCLSLSYLLYSSFQTILIHDLFYYSISRLPLKSCLVNLIQKLKATNLTIIKLNSLKPSFHQKDLTCNWSTFSWSVIPPFAQEPKPYLNHPSFLIPLHLLQPVSPKALSVS